MEEIVEAIARAEAEAETIKMQATERAAQILAEARERAAKRLNETEAVCKQRRGTLVKEAERGAEEEYEKTLSLHKTEAKKYADGKLQEAELLADQIVRRIRDAR